jgi:hypothetical protein
MTITRRHFSIAAPALATMLALMLGASSAQAATCGTEQAKSGGQVFRIKSSGTTCRVARFVAGKWFAKQSQRGSAPRVTDQQDRSWSCRIVRRATGTDPGYYPYTDVRCGRGSRPTVVRFSLRS